jgi:hypothetical protein
MYHETFCKDLPSLSDPAIRAELKKAGCLEAGFILGAFLLNHPGFIDKKGKRA